MNIKKLIFILLSLITSVIILFNILPKDKKNDLLIISDYLWDNYEFKETKFRINDNYAYSSLDSQTLLRYIEEDIQKIGVKTKSLKNEIKNAKYILISIGMEDFINNISLNTKEIKLTYDKDILSLHADIFINHYNAIIEEISLLNNKSKIIGCSLYYPYPYISNEELNIFINNVNREIKDINKNGIYLDLSRYSQEKYLDSISDFKLNTIALNKIFEEIISLMSFDY